MTTPRLRTTAPRKCPLAVFCLSVLACTTLSGQTTQPAQQLRQTVPNWVADAIFYQIFPERFRNGDRRNDPIRESLEFPDVVPSTWTISPWTGDWYARAPWEAQMGTSFYEDGVFHRRYGGDLKGVLDKMDYLQELGINAIYFNPVFYARSLHKYDGNSFHHVDPYFGPDPKGDLAMISAESGKLDKWVWTAADRLFLQLIAEAHRRQIRIIIDGVFNHTGRDNSVIELTKTQLRLSLPPLTGIVCAPE